MDVLPRGARRHAHARAAGGGGRRRGRPRHGGNGTAPRSSSCDTATCAWIAAAIGRVIVRFSDTNGHRGGVDKRCQIDVGLRPSGSVRSEDTDADLGVAVNRAADRVARAVARVLERERAWDEGPLRARTGGGSKA